MNKLGMVIKTNLEKNEKPIKDHITSRKSKTVEKIDGGQGMTLKSLIIEKEFDLVEIPEKKQKQSLTEEENELLNLVQIYYIMFRIKRN